MRFNNNIVTCGTTVFNGELEEGGYAHVHAAYFKNISRDPKATIQKSALTGLNGADQILG